MKTNNGDIPAMPTRYKRYLTEQEKRNYPHEMVPEFVEEVSEGLTKREQFAAMAMQGLLSGADGDSQIHKNAQEWLKDVTETSVEFADALLQELSK